MNYFVDEDKLNEVIEVSKIFQSTMEKFEDSV